MVEEMVIDVFDDPAIRQPKAGREYVMVYVPGVVAARLMTPVVALMDTPAGAVNVPPVVKPAANTGVGLVPFAQTGVV